MKPVLVRAASQYDNNRLRDVLQIVWDGPTATCIRWFFSSFHNLLADSPSSLRESVSSAMRRAAIRRSILQLSNSRLLT
jgi:hypothetical protein